MSKNASKRADALSFCPQIVYNQHYKRAYNTNRGVFEVNDITILPNIEEAMEDARNGKLSPYWQNDLHRECHRQKLSDEEQQALSELERILSETPQWSSEEELHHDMANIGGRVWYCHYWEEHYSMVQLTEDRNGRFNTAYVLDRNTSPEMRREAALLAQKELADYMQEWGVLLLDAPVPEQMKYASLAEAASHLMQVLNDPERIIG